jgi:hypothetical protein
MKYPKSQKKKKNVQSKILVPSISGKVYSTCITTSKAIISEFFKETETEFPVSGHVKLPTTKLIYIFKSFQVCSLFLQSFLTIKI